MKYSLILLCSILLFGNCKKNSSESKKTSSTTETKTIVNEEVKPTVKEKEIQYSEYYVAAESGLRMRKTPSLKGEKMEVIDYREAILVNTDDATPISPVSGFKGNMVAVKYGDKEGYMFDGFLTSIPPPSKDQTLKKYVRKLKIQEFKVSQKTSYEEITTTSELLLPTTNFQEAFLIAQRLGWTTGDFDLPNPSAPQTIFANHKGIKKTIIGTSMNSENGSKFKYTIPLPFYDKEHQYYTAVFEKFEKDTWNTLIMEVSKEFHYQKTTIQRKDDAFEIIYIETGE